ncbi:hypothetical protein ACOMHN_021556 [Nucella lapillus]
MDTHLSSSEQKCRLLCAPSLKTIAVVLLCVAVFFSWDGVNAEQASEMQESTSLQHGQYTSTMVICVSAVAFLLIMAYFLAMCTDCYKSEVSTDTHPATGQSEAKWGGAGVYSAVAADNVNDSVLGAGFTGEVVLPGEGSDQALPYTMIPAQVPEAQGFRGYGSAPPEQGLRGYSTGGGGVGQSGGGGGVGGRPQQLPGAHVGPMNEPEEAPPSYFSSTNR